MKDSYIGLTDGFHIDHLIGGSKMRFKDGRRDCLALALMTICLECLECLDWEECLERINICASNEARSCLGIHNLDQIPTENSGTQVQMTGNASANDGERGLLCVRGPLNSFDCQKGKKGGRISPCAAPMMETERIPNVYFRSSGQICITLCRKPHGSECSDDFDFSVAKSGSEMCSQC